MIKTFEKLLIFELESIYHTESKIAEFLPEIEKDILTPDLKQLVVDGVQEAKDQIQRVEKALNILKKKIRKKYEGKAIQGLIQESKKRIKSFKENSLLKDAVLIGALQNIKNYEASLYKSAFAHAKLLNSEDILALLQESLEEETTMELIL